MDTRKFLPDNPRPVPEPTTTPMTRPFAGIRIIDTSHVLAGPFATYQLAVLGADVIKVEHPRVVDQVREQGPDPDLCAVGMGTYYLTQGSNKRCITLDLATAAGREILVKLVRGADVFVENYRAGALAKLGLGYEDLARENPKLIYCSMTAFGQDGPRQGQTGYDMQIQATSGVMAATGTPEVAPLKIGPPVIDYGTGTMTAFALAAALFQRTHTGRGQYIDMAMFDVALMLMSGDVTNTLWTGHPPQPTGNDYPLAGTRCYPTRDGLLMIGAMNRRQHTRLFELFGRPEIAEQTDYGPRFSGCAEQTAFLHEIFLTRSADAWEQELQAHGIPAARVRNLSEALADPQLETRTVTHTFTSGTVTARPLTVPLTAFKLAHGGARIDSPPPRHGEHTDVVLAELGYDVDAIAALRGAGIV